MVLVLLVVEVINLEEDVVEEEVVEGLADVVEELDEVVEVTVDLVDVADEEEKDLEVVELAKVVEVDEIADMVEEIDVERDAVIVDVVVVCATAVRLYIDNRLAAPQYSSLFPLQTILQSL